MSTVCARCGRPQTDVATICHDCGKHLRQALHTITGLWPALQQAITRQTSLSPRTGNKPTKRDNQPLPLDLHASTVAANTRATLGGWVRVLVEDNHLTPPADTVPGMCGWLRRHTKLVRRHEAAGDITDEITRTAGSIIRAVDHPADKARIMVGPCPEAVEGELCPGKVQAHIPADTDSSPWMGCDRCGARWDTTQWAGAGRRIQRRHAQVQLQKSFRRAS